MQDLNEQSSLEDIPKETLIQTLKEKLRENKQIQKKLDKLQEKYVATYKENKLYQKDRETLIQALQVILSENPYKLEVKGLGQFDQQQLMEQLGRREEERSKALTNLIKETNNEKVTLEEKYKQMIEKSSQNIDQKSQQLIKQLKQQINDQEINNTRLAKEIIELNDIIQLKNQQLQNYDKLEEDFTNLKTQVMLNELALKQPNLNGKLQQSEDMNQQLRMKQQIDKLLEEIQRLRSQVKHYEQQLNNLTQQQQQQQQQIKKDYETNPFEDQMILEQKVVEVNKIVEQIEQYTQTEQQDENVEANFQYLKNVIYKYFLYQENRNYKEAQILMNAILTILKITKEDRKRIEDARDKDKGIFRHAKNIIADNLFCMKQSQLYDTSFQRQGQSSQMSQMNSQMN